MWIGTWGLNAGKGDLHTQRLKLLRFGLIEPNVSAMAFDGPAIWLAGIGEFQGSQGITKYNQKHNTWTYYEARYIDGLGSDNVTAIAADWRYVWFGTYSGLVQLDKKKDSWKTFTITNGLSDNEILDLTLDGPTLWIGTAFGISMLDKKTGIIRRVQNENLATSIVYDVEVADGAVWAATNHGLFTRSKGETEWDLFIDRQDRLGGVVAEIAASRDLLWFAAHPYWAAEERHFVRTQEYHLKTGKPPIPGKESLPISLFLSTYDKGTGTWEQFFPAGTFSFSTIYDLAVSDSIAWIATDEGVLKYDRGRDKWRRFTDEDGLIHNLVQTILPDGDHVWFGTPLGATRFYWNDPYRID
jgi:ligand-binding sensor domain-containing protein